MTAIRITGYEAIHATVRIGRERFISVSSQRFDRVVRAWQTQTDPWLQRRVGMTKDEARAMGQRLQHRA